MPSVWPRLTEPANPVSWSMVRRLFLLMIVSYWGLMSLSHGVRQQMESAHSLYWTFTFPASVCAMALLSLAVRLAGAINALSQPPAIGDSTL